MLNIYATVGDDGTITVTSPVGLSNGGTVTNSPPPPPPPPPAGSITVTKSGLVGDDEVIFTITGPGGYSDSQTISTTKTSHTWLGLGSGDYTITESGYSGYSVSYTVTDDSGTVVASGSGDTVTVSIGSGAGKSMAFTINVTNTRPTVGVAGIIEVAGISELPFTGMNPFIPISGMAIMIVGAVMIVLSVARRRKWKHELINNDSTSC